MSQSLSRWQAVALGLVVVAAVALAGGALARIAARQGLWADTFELTVGFPEAHDVGPGTPVRVRGVDAGQVVAVEYPDTDEPGAAVTLRLRLDTRFQGRLYGDAAAQIHSTGLLGSKVVAVSPGTPAAGLLADGRLRPADTPDFAQAAAQLRDAARRIDDTAARVGAAADEAQLLVKEVRTGQGTLSRLVNDDDLYRELKGLAKDSRGVVRRADAALGTVDGQVTSVEKFVTDGRETLRSVRQGTDAMQRLPIVRSYVEDAAAVLVRPTHRREVLTYNTADLFEPGTAVMTEAGRDHLTAAADWLKRVENDDAEVAVTALCDPDDRTQTAASAAELTRKQAESVVAFLKDSKAHKIGWVSRRTITPVGLGFGPSPVVEPGPLPPSYLQVVLFTPR